ncbi:hypothetical protein [Neobacillus cucumis]|uniref:hypothetical protein n=1 Tax=Neobacillus cucumis TaxID=1740721 RepID=UPI002853469D|nr:hypothetical protein [Neobacillus cucumis]MDR4945170.1 hypothetical protein [Neobacillus cucumis]
MELVEDELILTMVPKEDQLLSLSLQAEFEKELSHYKDELENLKKKEEKILSH